MILFLAFLAVTMVSLLSFEAAKDPDDNVLTNVAETARGIGIGTRNAAGAVVLIAILLAVGSAILWLIVWILGSILNFIF